MKRAMSFLTLLALSAGCNSVIGLSGYTFVDDGSAGGSAGTTGGSAGTTGGTAGDPGGGGGGGGEPGQCAVSDDIDEAYVAACALALACSSQSPLPTLSECIEQGLLPRFGDLNCLKTRSDCGGYFSCTGESLFEVAAPEDCPQGWACDGSRAFGCLPDNTGIQYDCAKLGGACSESTDNKLLIPCQVASVDCAGAEEHALVCNDGRSVQCIGGEAYGRSCDLIGACDKGLCTTTPKTCPPDFVWECKGSRLSRCIGGHIQESDCRQAGLACADGTADSSARCRAPGCSDEQIKECQEGCEDADHVRLCLGGAPFVFDCGVNGAGCVEREIKGVPHAKCELYLSLAGSARRVQR